MKKMLLSLMMLVGLLAPLNLLATPSAGAIAVSPACNRGELAQTDVCKAARSGRNSQNPVVRIVSVVVNILSLIGGAVAVIILVVSGIRLVTSQGDTQGVSGAKSAIIYAVIGLIVIALSQVIVRFVLNRVG